MRSTTERSLESVPQYNVNDVLNSSALTNSLSVACQINMLDGYFGAIYSGSSFVLWLLCALVEKESLLSVFVTVIYRMRLSICANMEFSEAYN